MDRVPLPEAARRLGLSSVAVRKRAQRGTLAAEKVDGQWSILLPVPAAQAAHGPPAVQAARAVQVDGQPVPPNSSHAVQLDGPAVDTVATAELGAIAREALAQLAREREVRSQAEQAAAMWQERARNLEVQVEQLLALPAHEEELAPARRWWQFWRLGT